VFFLLPAPRQLAASAFFFPEVVMPKSILARFAVPALCGLFLAMGTAIATYPRWSPWTAVNPTNDADPGMAKGKEHTHSHDEIPVMFLSDQARQNLKLETRKVKLVKEHWRKISVPSMVVERPGSCERLVSTPVGGVVKRIAGFRGEVVHPGEPLFTIELISEHLHKQQAELFKTARELQIVQREKERLLTIKEVLPMTKWIEVENHLQRLADSILAYEQELMVRGFSPQDLQKVKKGQFLREISVAVPGFSSGHPHPHGEDDPPRSPSLHTGYEVEEVKVMLGEQVQTGQALSVLADHYHLFIEGKVFAAEAGWIQLAARKGLPIGAQFTADTENAWPSWHDDLKIVNLSNRMDQTSQTLSFFLQLPNQFQEYQRDGKRYRLWRFRPGQRATLSVPVQVWPEPGETNPQPIFVLPAEAIVREGHDVFVFREKAGKDDVFERVSVQLLYEDQRHAVIANDGSILHDQELAMNKAVQLNWAFKTQNVQGGAKGHHHDHDDKD
jgi:membrane fusion protein, heavy metal efflux system